MAGRPDHHAIQAFLFVLLLGFGLRAVNGEGNNRAALWAGFVAAFALWTSLEALVVVAVVVAAFTVLWYWKGRVYVPAALHFAAALTFFCLAANMVERPVGDWLMAEFDRISIVHVMLFFLVTLFWLAVGACGRFGISIAGPWRRVSVSIIAAALGLAVVGWLYPDILDGPFADVPRKVYIFWHTEIAAHRPTFTLGDPLAGVSTTLFYLGPALVAAVYLPFAFARARAGDRPMWTFLALAMAVFVPMGFYQLRWNIYAELLALPIYALLLDRVLEWITARRALMDRLVIVAALRAGMVIVFVGGFVAISSLLGLSQSRAKSTQQGNSCNVAAVARHLSGAKYFAAQPLNILTMISIGPQLLYQTPHRVVATPDHRNAEGILDTIEFFTARNADSAKAIAVRRQLDLVMICPGSPEDRLFRGLDEQTLFDGLVAGQPPAWLVEVPLQGASVGGYRLFEVKP
jgi:hypothetical protein